MLKRFGRAMAICLFAISLTFFVPDLAQGLLGSCSAAVSPHTTTKNTEQQFTFTIDSTTDVERIEITRPSSNFSIYSASGNGWNRNSLQESKVIFVRGSSNPSSTLYVYATSGSSEASSADWTFKATDDIGGSDLITCTGSLDVSISNEEGPDTTPPNISNITVSSIRTNKATIKWTTNEPATSQVMYGTSEDYGSESSLSSSLVTSHSVTITGLNADTGYHFQVISKDDSDNETSSNDSTFLTPVVNTSDDSSSSTTTKVPIKSKPTEFVPPTIKIATDLSTPYEKAPLISGSAKDNAALAVIEYSIDGGENWLEVDDAQGLGSTSATYSFTPINLDDGNYQMVARAIDTSGNIGKTSTKTLVIDRLPPITGISLVSIGPQILKPNQNDLFETISGIDQKITINAVGGPTSINLVAQDTKGEHEPQTFALTKSSDSGLWSGILSFSEQGIFRITVKSVDGAGNKTDRPLFKARVINPGQLIDSNTKQATQGEVAVYYKVPETEDWQIWDGISYGQTNPQLSDKEGRFSFVLPPGTYYLRTKATDYYDTTSAVFTITTPTPVTDTINLKPKSYLQLGALKLAYPRFDINKINLRFNSQSQGEDTELTSLIDKDLPQIELRDSDNEKVNSINWLGKPTIITVGSSWHPTVKEQLPAIAELQKNEDANIVMVALQEGGGLARAYNKISGNDINWLLDPDSTLTDSLKANSAPTHYFVDRKGVVRKIIVGVLSKEELVNNLNY